jgi:hypothetical protein
VVEEIRKEFFAVYSPAKGETPEQRREAKRRQFDRYIESAQSEGLIRVREPEGQPAMAWFPNRSAQGE